MKNLNHFKLPVISGVLDIVMNVITCISGMSFCIQVLIVISGGMIVLFITVNGLNKAIEEQTVKEKIKNKAWEYNRLLMYQNPTYHFSQDPSINIFENTARITLKKEIVYVHNELIAEKNIQKYISEIYNKPIDEINEIINGHN